ncbi:lasso peptide biosynthesis B2 protein [Niallia sp. XMNu-256]|uniref:lasso peptide biosynthesis B2 protein n=1 Tax=Niallia sp. XMNu-256 TaxID=3082444 RepID=UPI0030D0F620
MSVLRKLKTFLKLDRKTKWLLLEAYVHLAKARYLKSVPFSKVAPSLGESMRETSFATNESKNADLARVSRAIHLMSRYTFWESECLVKAIAGMRMLEKRNIESTLYLGTAKNEKGGMIAHAWLRSGPYYISGAEEMNQFSVIAKFAKGNGNR